jgi:serine/threonine-protein kinase
VTAQAQRLVAGRYRLLSLIAVGGMGEVWRADDERLGRTVAIKLLKPEYGAEPAFLARFRGEARHAAGLSHAGIAAVFDYGEEQEEGRTVAYLVMELVDGEPLSQLLAQRAPLPPALALQIVGLTGLALQAAHDAGVIHRDVKPGNLIVTGADGAVDDVAVKVTDFGIARAVDSAPLTRTGMVMGTAHYLSPEQARAGTVTPASDVYALGVVAYECLVGRRPFTGDTAFAIAAAHAHEPPPPLPDDVPPDVRALVEYAMAKAPEARPPSAGAFGRSALALAATHRAAAPSSGASTGEMRTQPIAAVPDASRTRVLPAVPPVSPSTQALPQVPAPPPPAARRSAWPWVVAVVVLLIIGAAGWALSSTLGSGSPSPTTSPSTSSRPATATRTTTAPATHTTTAKPTTTAPTTTAKPTTTKPTTPASVTVNPSDYLGRQYPAAAAALARLGLVPTSRSVPSGGPAGSVTGVNPSGPVPRGSTVTLDVVAAPSASTTPSGPASASKPSGPGQGPSKGPSKGPGNGKKKGKGGNGGHGG